MLAFITRQACFLSESSYPLNRPKTAKLPFQILFGRIVVEPSNNQSFERVATNIWVLIWFDCRIFVST